MARVVGIDLGTTNSLVAVLEDGGPRCLPDPETGEILLPSAVAFLPDGHDRGEEGVIAVYDLGGGTFDISILRLHGGVFEVLSTNGDTRLGGDDMDVRLAERLLAELPEKLRPHPQVRAQVLQLAERTKRALSDREETGVVLAFPDGSGEARLTITRRDFEALIQDVVERTNRPCRQALKDAGLRAEQVEHVVAVGGSTRVPVVRRQIETLFGRPPISGID